MGLDPPGRQVLQIPANLVGREPRPFAIAECLSLRRVEVAHRLFEGERAAVPPIGGDGSVAFFLDPSQSKLIGLGTGTAGIGVGGVVDVLGAEADALEDEWHDRLVLVAAVALPQGSGDVGRVPVHRPDGRP